MSGVRLVGQGGVTLRARLRAARVDVELWEDGAAAARERRDQLIREATDAGLPWRAIADDVGFRANSAVARVLAKSLAGDAGAGSHSA